MEKAVEEPTADIVDLNSANDNGPRLTVPATRPLPRYRRAETVPPLLLQERDVALLEDVWRYRLLTTSQLETLRGADERTGCRFPSRLTLTRRLKLLFHHGFLQRIARPLTQGSLEPVYVLDSEGARVLSLRHGEATARPLSQWPKASALDHRLLINQMRLSIALACARRDGSATGEDPVEMVDWQGSQEVKFTVSLTEAGERRQNVTLIPDGFFSLRTQGRRLFFFVEADLGTEPGKTLADKCRAYYAYWHSGGFGADWGVPPQVAFRVLFIAPTPSRNETIRRAARTLEAGRTLFWTARQESITPEQIFAPVFQDGVSDELRSLIG